MTDSLERIDAHQHFWRVARGDYHWMSPDQKVLYRDYLPQDLKPVLQHVGIHRTVLVQAAQTAQETRFMLDLARATDFVAGVVGWVDMAAPDAAQQVWMLAQEPKLRGLRPMIQDIPDEDWMLRDELTPAFRAIIDQGLCFDALVHPRHLKNLHLLVCRHPELPVVVDHGAKPDIARGLYDQWAVDIARIAGEPQTFCKISGLITEAGQDWTVDRLRPYVDHLLACFGSDRLIWGSDWPVLNLAGSYERWWAATEELLSGLSDPQRHAVLGGNAARFYGL